MLPDAGYQRYVFVYRSTIITVMLSCFVENNDRRVFAEPYDGRSEMPAMGCKQNFMRPCRNSESRGYFFTVKNSAFSSLFRVPFEIHDSSMMNIIYDRVYNLS